MNIEIRGMGPFIITTNHKNNYLPEPCQWMKINVPSRPLDKTKLPLSAEVELKNSLAFLLFHCFLSLANQQDLAWFVLSVHHSFIQQTFISHLGSEAPVAPIIVSKIHTFGAVWMTQWSSHQVWQGGFNPWSPHGGRENWHSQVAHTRTWNKQKQLKKIKTYEFLFLVRIWFPCKQIPSNQVRTFWGNTEAP